MLMYCEFESCDIQTVTEFDTSNVTSCD